MKKCLFVTTPMGDGVSYYCGNSDNLDEILTGIRNLICVEDIKCIMGIDDPDIDGAADNKIVFKVKEMTDIEIANIQDI